MNKKMKNAWNTALKFLKADTKDIEHGLELHRNSLVFDFYGLEPLGPSELELFNETVENGISVSEIQEMKEDMRHFSVIGNKDYEKEYKMAWETSGVTCLGQNIGRCNFPLKGLARSLYKTDMMRDFLSRAVFPSDIEKAKKEGRHCLYFGSNEPILNQKWESIQNEFEMLRCFFQLGVRMMHLTYNRRNMIGDGCAESSDAGLSDFGRAFVREMNRVGIIVDVSHCGHKTSLDAASVSEKPLVASHSSAYGVHKHIRAKNDKTIKAIADTGGLIGVLCWSAFLGRGGDINAFLDHIDYIVKKFGVEHVAIGTDRSYEPDDYQRNRRKCFIRGFPKGRKGWHDFWPPGSESNGKYTEEARSSLEWTNWPLFTVGLVQRGYSDDEIQKIIGGNALRVTKAVFPLKQVFYDLYKEI